MDTKINIAELLKDCPSGMELDCTMYDNVKFDCVQGTCVLNEKTYLIKVQAPDRQVFLNKYGCYSNSEHAKCIIFPKGKTTWEGFQRPFKDGDVVTSIFQDVVQGTGIFDYEEQSEAWIHVCINLNNEFSTDGYLGHIYNLRLATEEEKQKLFKAIKDNGYRWNAETKTLEKLIEPKFKVGDRVRHCRVEGSSIYRVVKIEESKYVVQKNIGEYDYHIDFEVQDDWELVPNKFDITTLKPFDKVLVRDKNRQEWCISLFSHCNGLEIYKYSCINGSGYAQCVPYEENKHLLRTTNDCDEYYKIWE